MSAEGAEQIGLQHKQWRPCGPLSLWTVRPTPSRTWLLNPGPADLNQPALRLWPLLSAAFVNRTLGPTLVECFTPHKPQLEFLLRTPVSQLRHDPNSREVLSSSHCEIFAFLVLCAINDFKGCLTAKYARGRKGAQKKSSKLGHCKTHSPLVGYRLSDRLTPVFP